MDKVTEKWDLILKSIKEEYEIGNVPFKTWLEPLKVDSVKDNIVTLAVPSEMSTVGLKYIKGHYTLPLQVTISMITGMENCEVLFILKDEQTVKKPAVVVNPVLNARFQEANLNPKYTFDTFIIGSNNRLAQAAGLAVLEEEHLTWDRVRTICETREETRRQLVDRGFEALDSRTNFLFVRHPSFPGSSLRDRLREKGILIRWFDQPRIRDWSRITIGTGEQMRALVSALDDLMK